MQNEEAQPVVEYMLLNGERLVEVLSGDRGGQSEG
jgi:hypothetical protein